MRKVMGCLAGMALFVAGGGVASAGSYTLLTDLDDDGDNGINLTLQNIDFASPTTTAYYSVDQGTTWTLLGGGGYTMVTNIPANGGNVLDFALENTGDSTLDLFASAGAATLTYTQEYLSSPGQYADLTVAWTTGAHWTMAATSPDGMSPVPIPGSILLLGSGLAGLAVVGRRRQKTEG